MIKYYGNTVICHEADVTLEFEINFDFSDNSFDHHFGAEKQTDSTFSVECIADEESTEEQKEQYIEKYQDVISNYAASIEQRVLDDMREQANEDFL